MRKPPCSPLLSGNESRLRKSREEQGPQGHRHWPPGRALCGMADARGCSGDGRAEGGDRRTCQGPAQAEGRELGSARPLRESGLVSVLQCLGGPGVIQMPGPRCSVSQSHCPRPVRGPALQSVVQMVVIWGRVSLTGWTAVPGGLKDCHSPPPPTHTPPRAMCGSGVPQIGRMGTGRHVRGSGCCH